MSDAAAAIGRNARNRPRRSFVLAMESLERRGLLSMGMSMGAGMGTTMGTGGMMMRTPPADTMVAGLADSPTPVTRLSGDTNTPPPPGVIEQLTPAIHGYYAWGQPFRDPPVVASHNGQLHVTLTAAQQTVMIGGQPVIARVYNGSYIPPTLVFHPGDTLHVKLVNHLDQTTNLHFHGMHVSPSGNSDNVLLEFQPGQTFNFDVHVPKNHPSGTYWYHSHDMPNGETQVFGGMSGTIIVRGLRKLLPPRLRGIKEHTFDIKDLQVNDQGEIVPENIDSDAPTTRTINGQIDPILTMRPGETQLWHLANIGPDIFYDLQLDGAVFHVIGEDGNPVDNVWTANDLVMPPGKRYDVLVQAGDAGITHLRTLPYTTGPAGDSYPDAIMATIVTQGRPERPTALPTHIKPFHDLRLDPIASQRVIVFTENPNTCQFFINGKQFDPNRIDETVKLGTTEEWTIINATGEQHPFHIHTDPFQVVSINGVPYQARSLQDTVVLPVGGYVQMLDHFSDFTGTAVFHCHIMAHEDMGMMATVQFVR